MRLQYVETQVDAIYRDFAKAFDTSLIEDYYLNYKNSSGDEIANVNFCRTTTYM